MLYGLEILIAAPSSAQLYTTSFIRGKYLDYRKIGKANTGIAHFNWVPEATWAKVATEVAISFFRVR